MQLNKIHTILKAHVTQKMHPIVFKWIYLKSYVLSGDIL